MLLICPLCPVTNLFQSVEKYNPISNSNYEGNRQRSSNVSKDFEAICTLFGCLRRASGRSMRVIYRCGLQLSVHPREPTEGITTPHPLPRPALAASNKPVKKAKKLSCCWHLLCFLLLYNLPVLLQRFISSAAHRQYIAFTASLWRNLWEFMGVEPRGEGFLHGGGAGGNSYQQMGSSATRRKKSSKWVSDLEKYLALSAS